MNDIKFLTKEANEIRKYVLETVHKTGKGHIGGTFSCVDILVALYYGGILKIDPKNPKWEDRDRFILSKGHACLALYKILVDVGFFDKSRLDEFGKDGSSLGGQLNIDTPGVEYNTGSLGHAIGVGAGMALAAKMDNKDHRTFVLVGDGECDEGSIWESIDFVAKHNLNNLVVIIDRNRLSVTGKVDDSDKLFRKILAFGWFCSVINGHSYKQLVSTTLNKLDKPLVIIANTVKGKGVSFMEDNVKWHQSGLTDEEYGIAMKELEKGEKNGK